MFVILRLKISAGIEVSIHHSHTLFNPQELIEKNGGKAPTSMSQFQNLMKSMGDVPEPAKDPPKQFPALPKNAKSKDTNVPTLKDLKYVESKSPYRVDSLVLNLITSYQLDYFCSSKAILCMKDQT